MYDNFQFDSSFSMFRNQHPKTKSSNLTSHQNSMKHYFLTLYLALGILTAFGQQRYTISGIVTDGTSSESLIGATVYEIKSFSGTATNLYGFYSITLPAGDVSEIGRAHV